MCTVTFIPQSNQDFILTSNRDEAPGRKTLSPEIYTEDGVQLLYPKDAVAGGTWIGASDKNRVITLMNGGFVAHDRKSFYRKSRGLVVLDLLKCEHIKEEIQNYDFTDIEPFTVILVDWKVDLRLFQLVWDGAEYHFSEQPLVPNIWSSSPLYPENLKKKRQQWFSEFLFETVKPTEEEILGFHKTGGDGNLNENLVMDRDFVKTKSITQIERHGTRVEMRYEDLQTGVIKNSVIPVR